jgi:hypothetical protein
MRKTKKILIAIGVVILLIILCPFAYLAPYNGKVIDTETREPIVGAAVLVVYYSNIPTISGASSVPEDAQETITNSNGEFKISWKIGCFGFGKLTWFPEARVNIYKPGYGFFPRHKLSKAPGVNESWPPPKKYIDYEIPKLKTKEEKRINLPRTYHRIPYEKRKRYFEYINEERIGLGIQPLTIPREEK